MGLDSIVKEYIDVLNKGTEYLHTHGIWLYEICKDRKVLEIGVGAGRSTRIIHSSSPEVHYAIDRERGKKLSRKLTNEWSNFHFIGKDAVDALDKLDKMNMKFDVCFIDLDLDSNSIDYFNILVRLIDIVSSYGVILLKNPKANRSIIKAANGLSRREPYEHIIYWTYHGLLVMSKKLDMWIDYINKVNMKLSKVREGNTSVNKIIHKQHLKWSREYV